VRTVKVLLVDDDEDDFVITRELLSEIPAGTFDLRWAASLEAGLAALAENRPDVCIVDYRMGEHSGLDFLRRAIQTGLEVPMVMMTGHGDHDVDLEAMRLGAAAYLVKGQVQPALLERTLRYAVHRFAKPNGADPEFLQARDGGADSSVLATDLGSFPRLSDRELDVAMLIAEGRSNKEIADALGIGVPTVKKHVGGLLEKLGLEDRLQVGLFLARNPVMLRRTG
jgi:DNA-binding NarL/FixJ family response regulator